MARCSLTAASKSLSTPSVSRAIVASLDITPSSTTLAKSTGASASAVYVFPRSLRASTRARCVCRALMASSSFVRISAELFPACSMTIAASLRLAKTSSYAPIRASFFCTAFVLRLSPVDAFGSRRFCLSSNM